MLILTVHLVGFRTVYPDVGPTDINPGTININTDLQFNIERIESVIKLGSEVALVKSIYTLKFQTEQDSSIFDIIFPITTTVEEGYLFTQKNSNVLLSINSDLKLPNLLKDSLGYIGNHYHYKILENKSLIELEVKYKTKILRKSGNLYCDFVFSPIPENYKDSISSVTTKVSLLDIDITSITDFTANGLINANQEILWIHKNANRTDAELTINFEKESGLSNYVSQNVEYIEKTFYYFDREDIELEELAAEIEYLSKKDTVIIANLKDLLPTLFDIADSKDTKEALEFYLWIKSKFGDVQNISGKFSYLNFKIAECYFDLCEFDKAKKYYYSLIKDGELNEDNIRQRAESLFYKRSNQYSIEELKEDFEYLSAKGLIGYCKIKYKKITESD